MTKGYTWRDNANNLLVHKEEHTVKFVSGNQYGSTSTWLTPHEARELATALLIAAEAIEDEKTEEGENK